jgi:hypothetical protein
MDALALSWCAQLAGSSPRVVLTDGDDLRTVEAARQLAASTPVRPVLVTRRPRPVAGVEVLDPGAMRQDVRIVGCIETALLGRGTPAAGRLAYAADSL